MDLKLSCTEQEADRKREVFGALQKILKANTRCVMCVCRSVLPSVCLKPTPSLWKGIN